MKRYIYTLVFGALIISTLPGIASAQTVVKPAPRKYDKLLTAVESFAKLNAQIEIRQREYAILAPFLQDVSDYSIQLKNVCDSKCNKTVNKYSLKLKTFNDALNESHRRYLALYPNITERNAALMSEIKRVEFLQDPLSKDKAIAALNKINLENVYHYKAYNKTYHSADTAMLRLATSSDVTTIVNSFASSTDRLVALSNARPSMNTTVGNLKNRVPDIRARIKALEDRRKALVCTATLASDYTVGVRCFPN